MEDVYGKQRRKHTEHEKLYADASNKALKNGVRVFNSAKDFADAISYECGEEISLQRFHNWLRGYRGLRLPQHLVLHAERAVARHLALLINIAPNRFDLAPDMYLRPVKPKRIRRAKRPE